MGKMPESTATEQEVTESRTGEEGGGQEPIGQEPVKPALFDEPGEPEPKPEGKEEEDSGGAPLTKDDLTLPEGVTYDEELGKSFLDVVNDSSLSRKDLVNKLVGMYAEQQGKMLAAIQAADTERTKQFEQEMAKEKADWMKQCQADAEYGGQAWEASQAVIDRGCRILATPEAVALMQQYNLNTHPEVVRMFYRAGKLAGEDRGAQTGAGQRTRALGEAIFERSLKDWKKERGL